MKKGINDKRLSLHQNVDARTVLTNAHDGRQFHMKKTFCAHTLVTPTGDMPVILSLCIRTRGKYITSPFSRVTSHTGMIACWQLYIDSRLIPFVKEVFFEYTSVSVNDDGCCIYFLHFLSTQLILNVFLVILGSAVPFFSFKYSHYIYPEV